MVRELGCDLSVSLSFLNLITLTSQPGKLITGREEGRESLRGGHEPLP